MKSPMNLRIFSCEWWEKHVLVVSVNNNTSVSGKNFIQRRHKINLWNTIRNYHLFDCTIKSKLNSLFSYRKKTSYSRLFFYGYRLTNVNFFHKIIRVCATFLFFFLLRSNKLLFVGFFCPILSNTFNILLTFLLNKEENNFFVKYYTGLIVIDI
jgi:hypothetical protein